MATCYQCNEEKGLEDCVSCGKPVCKQHAGHLKNYVSLEGRKGRGCSVCIEEGHARPDYGMTDFHLVVPDAVRRFEHKFYPRILADLSTLTDQTKQETFNEARQLVKELEDSIQRTSETLTRELEGSADRIVTDTLEKVQLTLQGLTAEITNAITHQRVEVTSDAEKIVQEIGRTANQAIVEVSKAINTALLRAAIVLVVGLGSVAVLIAVALK